MNPLQGALMLLTLVIAGAATYMMWLFFGAFGAAITVVMSVIAGVIAVALAGGGIGGDGGNSGGTSYQSKGERED